MPFPPPGDLPEPGFEPASLVSPALVGRFFPLAPPGKPLIAESYPTLATTWAFTCQAPLSVGFSRQEYWSGLPFPSSVDLPHLGIEPRFPAPQADSLPTELPEKLFSTGILPSQYFSMHVTDLGSMFRIYFFFF